MQSHLNPHSSLTKQPGVFLAANSVSLDPLPLEERAQLLSALSEWIVNRSGITGKAKPVSLQQVTKPIVASPKLRIDAGHRQELPGPALSSRHRQLQSSVDAVRSSMEKLEAKLKLHPPKLQAGPHLSKPFKSLEGLGTWKAKGENLEQPKAWRRWIALDSVLQTRATIWRNKAARYGIGFNVSNAFPTGEQIWTDIDIVLNMIDQLFGSAISMSQRGDRIHLTIGQALDDPRWLELAIRTIPSPASSVQPPRLQVANKQISPAPFERIASGLQKRASILGGYIDQVSSREQGTAWKIHLPADDLMSWLERSVRDELHHVTEVVLHTYDRQSQEHLVAQAMDRAFQAALGLGQRAIQITPRRYLVADIVPLQDMASMQRRYQLQLQRMSVAELKQPDQFVLRHHELGSLDSIVKRIHDRLTGQRSWSDSPTSQLHPHSEAALAKARNPLAFKQETFKPVNAKPQDAVPAPNVARHVHGPHPLRPTSTDRLAFREKKTLESSLRSVAPSPRPANGDGFRE